MSARMVAAEFSGFVTEILEAPPGFDPGMEVLQSFGALENASDPADFLGIPSIAAYSDIPDTTESYEISYLVSYRFPPKERPMLKHVISLMPYVAMAMLIAALGDRAWWIVPPVMVLGMMIVMRIMGRRPVGGWGTWLLVVAAMSLYVGAVLKFT